MPTTNWSTRVLPSFSENLKRRPPQDQEFVLGIVEVCTQMRINRNHAIRMLKETAKLFELHTRNEVNRESTIIDPKTGRPYND